MRRTAVCLLAYLAVASGEGKAADCSKEKTELAAVQKEVIAAKSASSAAAAEAKKAQGNFAAEKAKLDAAVKETAKVRSSIADLESALKTEKSKTAKAEAAESKASAGLKAAEQTAKAAEAKASAGLKAAEQTAKAEKARADKLATEVKEAARPIEMKEHSVSGLLATMGSVSAGLHQSVLDKTTIDETVMGGVHKAKDATMSAFHATSHAVQHADYSAHYASLVAPHVAMVEDIIVANLGPHFASLKASGAIDSVYSAYGAVKDNVSPTLTRAGSMAYVHAADAASATPSMLHKFTGLTEEVVESIFKLFARVAPEQAKVLPSDFVDRLFFLLLSVAMLCNFYVLAKWGWWIVKHVLRFKKFIVMNILKPIFKVMKFTIGTACCFGTCCFCCGLCGKKKATNGKAAEQKTNGAPKQVTTAQVVQLLQKSKEKGKLNDGVKTLCNTVKKGTQLNAPPDMKGMIVTKDTLKQALAKFKEVDVKKLDL